jgi:hypothetical protein
MNRIWPLSYGLFSHGWDYQIAASEIHSYWSGTGRFLKLNNGCPVMPVFNNDVKAVLTFFVISSNNAGIRVSTAWQHSLFYIY